MAFHSKSTDDNASLNSQSLVREKHDSKEEKIIDSQHSLDGKTTTEPEELAEEDEKEYPPLRIVVPAMAALYVTVFLVAVDRTIIGTAIPSISNTFNSFGDVAWYEAGFLLPLCMLQLSFGRVYTYYSAKWVLFALVAVFEVGSIVCASAPSSKTLIVGRAVTGIGGAGITSGAFVIISNLVPLQARPKWTGGIGSMFGLASILGPILGGYLTSVTWRWCFWLNVPVGGVVLVLLFFFTPNRSPAAKPAGDWRGKLDQLDPFGFVLIAGSIVCLLFAVEWGGTKYAWNSGTIVALFVVFAALLVAFIAAQIWRGERATVPPRIICQRSVLFGCIGTLGVGAALVLFAFYLPIWFQVIQGKSSSSSGLSLLPLLLSNVFSVIAGGIATSVFGYYAPFMIIGSAILIVGSALLTTWTPDIGTGTWIGYQILVGVGLGGTLQQPNIAAQTVLSDKDLAIGLSILQFVNFLGGTVFVTVGQTLLENKLVQGLEGILLGLDPATITEGGATTVRNIVPPDQLQAVLRIYNDSIRSIWYLALGLACLIFVSSWGLEWKSVKTKKDWSDDVEASAKEF